MNGGRFFGLSDFWMFGQSDYRIFGRSDKGLSDVQIFGQRTNSVRINPV